MPGYKVVHHIIKGLQNYGFTAKILENGEYPRVKFTKGRSGFIEINFDTNDVEGTLRSRKSLEEVLSVIKYYLTDVEMSAGDCKAVKLNGSLFSKLVVECKDNSKP